MNIILKFQEIMEILNHPANRSTRITTFLKYIKWNVGRRLIDHADYAITIRPGAELILSNRENYATLAYTCGMYDYSEMLFLTHYLRAGDILGDFGANVGVYSVLAGSVGARVLAVEPVPVTYARLLRNLMLNGVNGEAINCGLSDSRGKLKFTRTLGGLNHVARATDADTIEVEVMTSDELVKSTGLAPNILKIDVEGFELPVLRGSSNLLRNVDALIVELNGSGKRFEHSDRDVHNLLAAAGFGCFDYLADSRELRPRSDFRHDHFNSLYIKQDNFNRVRLRILSPH